jgi:inactivated superfamily I helicase
MTWHLAQLNIGRLRAPTDDPATAEFMANLDRINALAEVSPGFVWRLQTEQGNATAIRAFPGDELMILNMSVWESIETLADYVYRSAHTGFLRRRGDWFERLGEVYLVLWWVAAGTLPTIDEALARLDHLRAAGPTPEAFTFRHPFPHPGGPSVAADDRNACPV